MKHEAIEQQQEVAYGLPNTAITGKKQALMQVRLDIPSNDQYGGALWVPLYLTPPTSTAIAAMVIKQAANCCGAWMEPWDIQQKILALTPANAEAELEALTESAKRYQILHPNFKFAKTEKGVRRMLDEKGE